jgi:thiamine kinase-like enzyme
LEPEELDRAIWQNIMINARQNTVIGLRLLPSLNRLWRRWGNRRDLDRACALVPSILGRLSPLEDVPSPATWSIQRAVWTETNTVVIALGLKQEQPTAILKLPQTPDGLVSLQRQMTVLSALRSNPGLGEWCTLLPKPLAQGEVAGQAYVVEQVLPGCNAQDLLSDPAARMRMQIAAAATIRELHRRTATSVVVDGKMLERWVDQPINLIRRSVPPLLRSASVDGTLKRLAAEIHAVMLGRTLPISWIHGDFWPGNLLVTPDGATVTGIVDWDFAAPDELPLHDLLHLLLYTRKLVQRCELGDVIRATLAGEGWLPHERALLDAAGLVDMTGGAAGERAIVLIYWLRHIVSNFVQSAGYARNWLWMVRNIKDVLQQL